MPRRRAALVQDERGVGVVTALMVTLVVFAAGVTWTGVGVHQVESSSYERLREQALHAAEAGVNLAVSELAGDLYYPGTTTVTAMAGDDAEFEVTVSPVDPTDPDDLDRYIVARGYAPTKGAGRVAVRQLEQQVVLEPVDGFNFALFASPGGVAGNNYLTVTGDVYSSSDIAFANNSTIHGDVTGRGSVSTANSNTIDGDVHALGDVTLNNTQTVVHGSVFSGGDVAGTGSVGTDVQAGGTVSLDPAKVGGSTAQNSPPAQPPALTQPTFVWDPNNYTPVGEDTAAGAFVSDWNTHRSAFGGHYRITDTGAVTDPVQGTTLTGDLTIYAQGPITIARNIQTDGNDYSLTIVSMADQAGAVVFSNRQTFSNLKVVVFAPNGSCDFTQLQTIPGVVYCESINLSQSYTLNYAPPAVPGFEWTAASATHFYVKMRTFREVVPT